MKKTTRWKAVTLAAALSSTLASTAFGAAPVLNNASFETTTPSDVPSGTQPFFDNASYVLSDWTEYNGANTAAGYVYNRDATQWSAGYGSTDKTPFGDNVLGLGRGGASSVIQTVGQVATGESYTLSGLIGRPSDLGTNPTGGYTMALYLGATPGALTTQIMVRNNDSVTDPDLGTWKTFSGSSSVITSGQNGQYLTVYIYAATGAWPSVREFDNIQVTLQSAPTVDLTSSLNPSGLGDSVTFTATVSGTPTPTGTIQFQVDGVNAGSPVALDGSGVATFVTSSLTLGERIVDALYSGDATYQGGYDRVYQQIANNQPVASVQNGSFETEVLADGTRNFFSDAVWKLTGWTKFNGNFTGQGYFQNYSSAQLTSEYGGNPLPDGEQVLGLGRGGLNEAASVYQDLGTVSTGNTYTLAGQLGRPATQGLNEVDSATGYYMELYVGDTWEEARNTTPILSLDKTDVPDPALGDWDAWSGTSSAITAEQNGKHLYVRLYVNPGPTFPSIREFDDISVTVNSGSPYASWSQFYFSTPSADPNDDPDFDGASNLLEYGAGTVPNQPNPSSTPVNYAVASGNSNLSITFTLVESATDLSYIVQTSTNLSTWTDEATYVPTGSGYSRTGTGTTQTADVDNGTTRTLTEQASAPVGTNARRFIRVKVVK